MKYKKLSSIAVVVIIALTSFWIFDTIHSSNVEQKLSKMMSIPINLQFTKNDYCRNSTYKMVTFVDSAQCSTCLISSFHQWNHIIDISEARYNLDFLFIVNPKRKSLKKTQIAVRHTDLKSPIIIDSTGVFTKNNPQIPSDSRFHTFLLNEDNEIILVGNPLHSKSIFNMLIQTLEEKAKIIR